jgi:RNA recognition motif-containing protein
VPTSTMRTKLFVGNLSYDTTVSKLEAAFGQFPGYSHAKVRFLTCRCSAADARAVLRDCKC